MLQKQNISIPVNASIDTKSDPFLTDAQSSLTQENTRYEKTGAIQKRNGYDDISSSLSSYISGGGLLKRVYSDGNSLLLTGAAGKSDTRAYSASRGQWEKLYNQGFVNLSDNALGSSVGADIELVKTISGQNDVSSFWVDRYDGEILCLIRATNNSKLFVINEQTGAQRVISGDLLHASLTSGACCFILEVSSVKYYCAIGTDPSSDFMNLIYYPETTLAETVVTDSGYLRASPIAAYVNDARTQITATARASTTTFRVGNFDLTGELTGGTNTFNGADLISAQRPAISPGGSGSYYVSYSQSSVSPGRSRVYAINSSFAITTSASDNVVAASGGRVALASTTSGVDWFYESNTASPNRVNCTKFSTSLVSAGTGIINSANIVGGAYAIGDKSFVVVATHPVNTDYVYKSIAVMCFGALIPDISTIELLSNVASCLYDRTTIPTHTGNIVPDSNGEAVFAGLEALRADVTNGSFFNGTSVIDSQTNTIIDGLAVLKIDPLNNFTQYGSTVSIGGNFVVGAGLTGFFDGAQLAQIGTAFRPYMASATGSTVGGTITAGTYLYKLIYEFFDANGNVTYSQESNQKSVTTTGSTSSVTVVATLSNITTAHSYRVTLFRTKNNGAVFYKVLDTDILEIAGAGYTLTASLVDTIPDSQIASSARTIYTTGGVLENDPPPPCKHATTHNNRVFLVPADEFDKVWYSKKIIQDEIPSFSQFLFLQIFSTKPGSSDKITGVASLGDKLLVFREQSIFWVGGDGANELGQQQTFTEPEKLSTDIGCIENKSIIEMPQGVMFKSNKGIYIVTQGLELSYIGAAVEAYNSEEVLQSILVKDKNIVKFFTASRVLVFNYLNSIWSIDTIASVKDACLFTNKAVVLKSTQAISIEGSGYTDDFGEVTPPSIQMKIQTGWMKLSGIQDYGRVWRVLVLGRWYSSHTLTLKAYYDYDDTTVETYTITASSTPGRYQYNVHLKRQKCEALKLELFDTGTGQSLDLTGLTLEVGVKKGTMKLPATRKL